MGKIKSRASTSTVSVGARWLRDWSLLGGTLKVEFSPEGELVDVLPVSPEITRDPAEAAKLLALAHSYEAAAVMAALQGLAETIRLGNALN